MHFVLYAFSMLLVGIAFSYLFSLGVGPLIVLMSKTENKVTLGVLVALAIFVQAFLILGWDAYTLTRSIYFSQGHTWLYVGFGFFATIAPLGYMASREDPNAGPQTGSCIYLLLAVIGYWVFYFSPALMFALYGWFLNWWFK